MDVASRFGLVSFGEGQFKGRTLRSRLELAQEPTTGRKSGEKDRRPLANVPIVRVRISEVFSDGREIKIDENSIDPTSLLCSVDLCSPKTSMIPLSSGGLPGPSSQASTSPTFFASTANHPFPYPTPSSASDVPTPTPTTFRNAYPFPAPPLPAQRRNHVRVPRGGGRSVASPGSSNTSGSGSGRGNGTSSGVSASGHGSGSGSASVSGSGSGSGGGSSGTGGGAEERVGTRGKTVRNLFGNLIAPAVCLSSLEDEPGLWFIFQDIAVRTEGVYSLRFSFFDLDSRTADSLTHAPILAECFSSPLTIYAPRNHPGVPPSTKLAKHFVSQGYRLSLKKGGTTSLSGPTITKPSDPSSSHHSSATSSPSRERCPSNGESTEIPDEEEDDDPDGIGEVDDGSGNMSD